MTHSITAIKAFKDNYIWLVKKNTPDDTTLVVDPGEASGVIDYLKNNQLTLSTILLTHHHSDHIGGVSDLKQAFPNCIIVGPYDERIEGITQHVREQDTISLPLMDLEFKVIEIPGHTKSHIAYINEHWVFCGDTLFAGGCGRLFEGSPLEMFNSLARLKALHDDLLVYPAHEYTESNLKFARTVEPSNAALSSRLKEIEDIRRQDKPSLPTNILIEKMTNPFFRCDIPEIQEHAKIYSDYPENPQCDKELWTFSAIREMKNRF